jgi:hypothetical protein
VCTVPFLEMSLLENLCGLECCTGGLGLAAASVARSFISFLLLLLFWVCAFFMSPLVLDIMLVQRLGVKLLFS